MGRMTKVDLQGDCLSCKRGLTVCHTQKGFSPFSSRDHTTMKKQDYETTKPQWQEHKTTKVRPHIFCLPADSDSLSNSCDFEFKIQHAQYYLCIPSDNYAFCQMCKRENMHRIQTLIAKPKDKGTCIEY